MTWCTDAYELSTFVNKCPKPGELKVGDQVDFWTHSSVTVNGEPYPICRNHRGIVARVVDKGYVLNSGMWIIW